MQSVFEDNRSLLEDGLADVEKDISKEYDAIAEICQIVSRQLHFLQGVTKNLNPIGEQQAELDVFSNQVFPRALLDTARVEWVTTRGLKHPNLFWS